MATTTTKATIEKAIKTLVETSYMNKTIKFDDDWKFRVKGFNVRESKRAIRKAEFDDYGVDPDTVTFIIVEFWDAKEESDATDAACVFFTLNSKGQVGTADVPYDFEVQGANLDIALKMEDELVKMMKESK